MGFLRAGVFLAAGTGAASDHSSIQSSNTCQVELRAARPVSIPRWPPGTISKRTSADPVSSGTTALTALMGAMESVAPPKTSTGAVIFASSMVLVPKRIRPSTSPLPLIIRW